MKTKRLFRAMTAVVLALGLALAPVGDIPLLRDFAITASAEVPYSIEGDTLYINGSGQTDEYKSNTYTTAPWRQDSRYSSVTNIVIGSEITRIGSRAFYASDQVKSITILGSTKIGQEAFRDCKALETVNIYKGAKLDGSQIFNLASGASESKINTVNIIDGTGDSDWTNIKNGKSEYGGFKEANVKYVREITFVANNGTGDKDTQYLEYNKEITLPTDTFTAPANTHFKCWAKGSATGEQITSGKTTFTAATTLYAIWESNEFTIKFDKNGGSVAPADQKTTNKKLTSLPSAGEKTGYRFAGWYTAASGGTQVTTDTTFTAGITIYAHWIKTYTVTYNGNGNTSGTAPAGTTHDTGSTVTVSSNSGSLAKTGYTFVGWNTAANGTGTDYAAGSGTFTIGADTTLYAKWNINSYTVSFDSKGGSAVTAQTITYGGKATKPADPTKTGYTFDKWCSDSSLNTAYDFDTAITGNKTLYAKWTANTYTVSFNKNGGEACATASKTVTYDSAYGDLPTPTRTGYTFSGWYTAESGGTQVTGTTTVKITSAQTLYAHWTINKYTVTYDYATNGGTSATKTTATVNYNSSIDLAPTATKNGTDALHPTDTGHPWTFAGWNTDKDATTGLTSLTMGTGNITLYAIYKKTLTAIFYSGSGCGTQTSSVTIYNNATSGNVTAPALTAWDGYTALGWNSSVSAYTKEKAANDNITLSADTNYYGVYSREVTLTYHVNGGTGTVPASQTATSYANVHSSISYSGGEITLAAGDGVSRTGYTFAGWKTSADGTTVKQPGDTVQFTADSTYYVNWKANHYTVSYHGNGSTGGSTADSTHIYDTAKSLTANGFQREYKVTFHHNYDGIANTEKTAAYIFAGWGISETGTEIEYENSESVTNLTAVKDGTFHLYARWTPVSVNYIPTRACYTFGGWYAAKDCSGERVDSNGTYTPTAPITLYAKWTENKITEITHKSYDGTYDLANHSIEVRGTLPGDQIEYSTDGTNYDSQKPTFKDIGTYTVYYKVKRYDYFDYTDSATVTIRQKELSSSDIAVEGIEDKTYTGSEITQAITLKDDNGNVIPESEYNVEYSDNTAAGHATVTITNADGGNYKLTEPVIKYFTIKKAAITWITFEGYTGIYDGAEHSITVKGMEAGDVIEYSTDGTDYSATNPAFKDAETYTVDFKVKRDNYNDFTGTATVTIHPKDVTISGVKAADKTYDGQTESAVTGTPKIQKLVASDKDKVSVSVGTAAFEDKNVGTNKTVTFAGFTLTGEKAGNYHLSAQPESVTASISKAPVIIVWKEEAITYNGEPQKPGLDSVSGIVNGDDCSVEVSGDETNATKAGRHGTATASLIGEDKDNYYILSGETENFTIARKELTEDMIALDGADHAYSFTGSDISPVVTVSDGNAMTADDYTIGGKTSATDVGSYDLTVTGKGNYTGKVTVTWQISDPNPPTGSIAVSANNWISFSDTVTFDLCFKEAQTMTITGRDGAGESGVDKLYYYLSETKFASEDDLALVADWTELSAKGTAEKKGSFSIDPDQKLIIYAKITDKSGNVSFLNSNGIILDATAPVIEGVTDDMSYCAAQTVTISDDNLDKVTVNGSDVTLTQGKYTLAADGTEYTIAASDKAGNRATVTVTVNNGHTAGEAKEENRREAACTEDGSYDMAVYCEICGVELGRETNAIEATGHSFGKWKKVKSPNCTDKGSKKRSCTACGYTETEDVDAAGHSWEGSYTTDKEATCTADGSRSIHCSECDAVKDSSVIPATGHDFGGAWGKDADGHWKECSRCGVKEQTGGHSYDNDKDASCNVCGYTRAVVESKNDNPGSTDTSDDKDQQPEKQEEDGAKKLPENDDKQPDFAENDEEPLAITGEKITTGNIPEAEGAETTLEVGKGKVVVSVVCKDEDYTAGVVDTVAVANAVLTPEQIQRTYTGENVEIRVDIQDISEHVPVSEKEAVEECIEQQNEIPDLQLGMYIDISMYIRIGDSDWNPVTQTKEPIDVVIGIPEELRGEGRNYYIVRSHEGGITLLYDMDNADDTITIRTGQFSTYAIAYAQADVVANDPILTDEGKRCSLCHICPTFSGVCCFIWLAVIVLIVLMVIVIIRMLHRRHRKKK